MHKNDTIWTAIRKADKQALKQIINVNPDVINIRGPVGECPIHMLFLYGTEAHLDIARYLITQFPHIVTQIYNQSIDSNGNTILHMLVIHNLPEIYTKFKERWLRDKNLTESFDTYDTNMTEISNKQEVLLWNRMNKDGLTPMTLAAKLGRAKMLSFLLDERKILLWAYGDISCLLHPLDQLDLDLIEKNRMALILFLFKVSNIDISNSKLEIIGKNDDQSTSDIPTTQFINDENMTLVSAKVIFRGIY
ncbi:unnamed protein product [Rotaria sp. Silwood2]|nr:unnamed protein product [Rotaria sp. Silwood2]